MKPLSLLIPAVLSVAVSFGARAQSLKLNDLGYFEARGTNVLVYNNLYNGSFYDEKFAGLEIIQRGERISTGGGVRLMNTPEQWDIFGVVSPRKIDRAESSVEAELNYADYGFAPRLKVLPKDQGVLVQIWLDKPNSLLLLYAAFIYNVNIAHVGTRLFQKLGLFFCNFLQN